MLAASGSVQQTDTVDAASAVDHLSVHSHYNQSRMFSDQQQLIQPLKESLVSLGFDFLQTDAENRRLINHAANSCYYISFTCVLTRNHTISLRLPSVWKLHLSVTVSPMTTGGRGSIETVK